MFGDGLAGRFSGSRPLRRSAGLALSLMIVAAVLDGFGLPTMGVLGGLAAWSAAAVLWRDLAPAQARQCAGLIATGLAALAWAALSGAEVSVQRLLHENLGLLAMIAATSFIRLTHSAGASGTRQPIADQAPLAPADNGLRDSETSSRRGPASAPGRRAPVGARALLGTLAGLNLLGAAINMTALVLFADRVAQRGVLRLNDAAWLARAFSLAVLYSPFIGGMAFALNQAPDASLARVAAMGVALSALGIAYTWRDALRVEGERVAQFEGFPFNRDALALPALLAVAVLGFGAWLDQVPVLALIALLAPTCVLLVVTAQVGLEASSARCVEHVRSELPRMAGELWLFLAAGVLAVGISSALAASSLELPFTHMGGALASLALLTVVLLGAVGLHPVISLSALVPMLQPLSPPPDLLVLLCVCGWSLGCALCPYAGINLILQGRFGISGRHIVGRSYAYGAFMWLACSVVLCLLAGGL